MEPEWEAVFEANSYGFRPGRNSHDAIEALFSALHHGIPKWVYKVDIRHSFGEIDHDSLLEKISTFPEMESQIKSWLKAGIMKGFFENESQRVTFSIKETPQNGILFPFFANIALHGLEIELKNFVANLPIKPLPTSNNGRAAKQKALTVVRYTDNFVILHANKEILELCIAKTHEFISTVGITVNPEKSYLKKCTCGFSFLGFQIIQLIKNDRYKVKITPSRSSNERLLSKTGAIMRNYRAVSSYQLIMMLRPIILGWGNYFKYSECSDTFQKNSHLIFQQVRAWVFRRDTRHGRMYLKEKYFPSNKEYLFQGTKHKDNWILFGTTSSKYSSSPKEAYLPHMSWIQSVKHVKVIAGKSPFDGDHVYWTRRMARYNVLPIRVRTLLKLQKGICTLCRKELTTPNFYLNSVQKEKYMDVIEGNPGISKSKSVHFSAKKDVCFNLQLIHCTCHVKNLQSKDVIRKTNNMGQELDEAKVSCPDRKTGILTNESF